MDNPLDDVIGQYQKEVARLEAENASLAERVRELEEAQKHDVVCNADRHAPFGCSCIYRVKAERDALKKAVDEATGLLYRCIVINDGEGALELIDEVNKFLALRSKPGEGKEGR